MSAQTTNSATTSTDTEPPTDDRDIDPSPGAGRSLFLLLVVALAPTLIVSADQFGQILGTAPLHPRIADAVRLATAVGAAWWLVTLATGRPRPGARKSAACTLLLLGASAQIAGILGTGEAARTAEITVRAVLLVWLTLEVCAHHGVTWRRHLNPPGTSETPAWQLDAALMASMVLTCSATVHLMSLLMRWLPDWMPVMEGTSSQALGWTSTLPAAAHVMWTGIAEELILVVGVACLGRAARLPVSAVLALSITVRVAGHLYLGAPALGVVLLAYVSLYLYYRWRRPLPLVVGHIAYYLVAASALP